VVVEWFEEYIGERARGPRHCSEGEPQRGMGSESER
jgi:hypothetical protein